MGLAIKGFRMHRGLWGFMGALGLKGLGFMGFLSGVLGFMGVGPDLEGFCCSEFTLCI